MSMARLKQFTYDVLVSEGYCMSEDMLYKMDRVQLERRIGKEVAELILQGTRR